MEPKGTPVFINGTDKEFADISSEEYRTYQWSDGAKVTIQQPRQLYASASGHRIWDAFGISHYVPLGWVHLWWAVKEGQPNFVK